MKATTFKFWWRLFIQRWDKANQPELAAFYRAELDGMTDEQFAHAARQALRSMVYFPTVEELEELAGVGQLTAAEAWTEVLPYVQGRKKIRDRSVEQLPDAAIKAVGAMGGLHAIGRSEKDLHFRRKEFMELYDDAMRSQRHRQLPPLSDRGRKLIESAMGKDF